MTLENFQTVVEALSDRRPFQPFTIELTGGQRFEVDHPHALAYREGIAFYLAPGRVPFWFDHERVSTIREDIANTSAS